MKKLCLVLLLLTLANMIHAQQVLPLYDVIPNAKPGADQELTVPRSSGGVSVSKVSKPTLTVFLPPADQANGTAIVVCPGGGYTNLSISHEGYEIAKKLNEMGVAAFVLKYRIPNDSTMVTKETGPIQDAQRAIQMVRQRAREWHVNTDRVGILGFSAGGHLASTAGTHFSTSYLNNKDTTSVRPDFMVLLYPVISFSDSLAHMGSRNQLIGKSPAPEKIREYSNELQVTARTPPTFLVHAQDDRTVKVQNSIYFYLALHKNNVPAEMHLYPKGGHGFGLNNPTTPDKWMERLGNWLGMNGWLKK